MSKKKHIKWIVLTVLIIIFISISMLINFDKISYFDNLIYGIISKCINPTMTKIVKVVTSLANPITVVIFALIISLYLGIVKKDRKTAIIFCINLVIAALFNYLLKNIFVRTRPEMINIITETGYSFPSGHSSIAVAFYGYLIYLINSMNKKKKVNYIVSMFLTMLILLIGLSRVYLGVHYASDVVGGFTSTLSYLIIYISIVEKISIKINNKITGNK